MNTHWQTFLNQQGAHFQGDEITAYADCTAPSAVEHGLCDLSPLGLVTVHGADAGAFLQGQLTNDVKQLHPGLGQLNAYCTPQGRMLALFHLVQCHPDQYTLIIPQDILTSTLDRLKKYVMRSQVTWQDNSNEWAHLGVWGPNIPALLQRNNLAVPTVALQCLQHQNLTIYRHRDEIPRFSVWGNVDDIKRLWEQFSAGCVKVGDAQWRLRRILSGEPVIFRATVDQFVPQMMNLDLIDGVNFNKGCYPGQEIVARTRYLGKVKRRLFLAKILTTHSPKPGDRIVVLDQPAEVAGDIVDAATASDGTCYVLAVLQLRWSTQPLVLDQDHTKPLALQTLPYEIAEEALR